MSTPVRFTLVVSASLALSCQVNSTQPPQDAIPVATADPDPAVAWNNPGGMWTPAQMAEHAQTLQRLGLELPPAALTDPTAFPLGAVVSLGGCSASFVSPQGLAVTNHHCGLRALQFNSTPEENLLAEGFLAKTPAEERWAGPRARIYVTTSFADVTADILAGLDAIADSQQRYEALEKRVGAMESGCEAENPGVDCDVARYFEGAQYFLIQRLEIRDVRLVYAPDEGIGVFGGEIDNWRWPRHTGDFTFLRAYVGPDGKPADHAAANVPYQPPHHLRVATEDIDAGDFVMVAGYPGRTFRLKTADEVKEAVEWSYPHRIERIEAQIALLEDLTKTDPELGLTAATRLRGLHNALTNSKGALEGLTKGGLLAQKQTLEAELQGFIAADPARKQAYAEVLPRMAALSAERRKTRAADAAVAELTSASTLLAVAGAIYEAAEQRAKKPADRRPGFEAGLKTVAEQLNGISRSYDPRLDRARLGLALRHTAALPEDVQPKAVIEAIVGKAAASDGLSEVEIEAALDRIYAKTKLGNATARIDLLNRATLTKLGRSRDPFIAIVVQLKPLADAAEARDARFEGEMSQLRPSYIAALREFTAGPLAPDANGTLRLTFGTIRGYRPTPSAEPYLPFTTLTEQLAKDTGEAPFALPSGLREAAKTAKQGPWVDPELRDVPVDFLADLDITGGNSGSATLNAKGELIGLVFDGNYESIASDWVFMPEITRSIHVDARYMLFVMDRVDGAQNLLKEMGVDKGAKGQPATAAAGGRTPTATGS